MLHIPRSALGIICFGISDNYHRDYQFNCIMVWMGAHEGRFCEVRWSLLGKDIVYQYC